MNMDTMSNITALFDLDGVILDTETQYTVFWHQIGVDYLGKNNLEKEVKGQTLTYIYNTFFFGKTAQQEEITEALDRFEQNMSFNYIHGVEAFIVDLKDHGVNMAIVTSSNKQKMAAVHHFHPELWTQFDHVLTAEMFAHSKPAPDCFLLGMEIFNATPQNTYVFEDSFNGLKAGMASGATVIGLATTNSNEALEGKAHYIINDFNDLTYDKLIKCYTFATAKTK